MSRASLLKALKSIKKSDLRPGLRAGLFTGLAAGGAAQGFAQGDPGHRIDAAKEGLLHGAFIGGAVVGGAVVGKRLGRKARVMGKRKGKLMFRRIRGRLVPIRSKK